MPDLSAIQELLANSRRAAFRTQFLILLPSSSSSSSDSSNDLEPLYRLMDIINESRPRPTVNWIYEKQQKSDLSRTNKKNARKMAKFSIKKQVSNFNFEKNDLFQQFMNSNTVNQIFYKDCDSLLGSTCDICILQNFTSITPNNLAKIIETVSGGGSIIYLVENCSKIEDLITMNMKYHSHIQSELFRESFHNLNKRFVYTLLDSKHSLFLNSDLKILNSNYNMSPFEYNVRPENSAESWSNLLTKNSQNETLYKLLKICKTRSQAHGLLKLYKFITQEPEEQFASQCVYLNSARGRGKSALLGIALALFVIENRFSNIAITAPTVEQLRTTFEFLITSLKTLDYA
ncbi:MAG: N-acetyltransferase 10, partial [Marteilia pararefringens]